ncbi:hypothetical protein [Azospirillum sp.]|uniref:hypothetical protein n=1 Tax=Azospirillum sp. TaxID=34012 RepID=UPI002D250CC2|nr:hypothetical protein [Azospirillum sp.]HYD64082.1 hypothetical protein [Azospirillum sp.]
MKTFSTLAFLLPTLLPIPALADPPARLLVERWLARADAAANEAVTHEICGWGAIDLRTPLLEAALAGGVEALVLDELARRFDGMVAERRRLEAVLALQPANAPAARTTGLFATDGCPDQRRQAIGAMGR